MSMAFEAVQIGAGPDRYFVRLMLTGEPSRMEPGLLQSWNDWDGLRVEVEIEIDGVERPYVQVSASSTVAVVEAMRRMVGDDGILAQVAAQAEGRRAQTRQMADELSAVLADHDIQLED